MKTLSEMKTLSLRARLTLQWTLSFGLLLLAANAVIFAGARAFLLRDFDAQLRALAGTEFASATDGNQGVHLHDFPADAFDREVGGKFVQILSADGRVLKQSATLGDQSSLVPVFARQEALRGGSPLFAVTTAGRQGRMTALSTTWDGETFVIAVGLFTELLDRTLSRLVALLASVWITGIVLTGLLGSMLAARALAPVHRIMQRAAMIATGQFATRLDQPAVDDEIGRMTRLLNQMLDRLHAAIQANQRFAADASHELRAPLTAMLGEIDVTLKRDRQPQEYRDTLATIREHIEEMSGLTESLMVLVRAQEGHRGSLVEISVTKALKEAAHRIAATTATRAITIRIDALPDLVAYADERLLARVFDNVLRNAVQHNIDPGLITITGEAGPRPADSDWAAGFVNVSIRDTGAGIADGDRERVFERFYRTDRSRLRRTGGAGLGLAICREVMTLLNGSIRIADSSPQGTTIEIQLPGSVASSLVTSETVIASRQTPALDTTH